MMVLITSVCGEGSVVPACTHDLAWAFAPRIYKQSMQVEEDSNNFKTSSLSGHARMSDY